MEKEGHTLLRFSNGCCEYTCTMAQVIDYVVQPTILEFVKKICECVVAQEGIPQKFIIDNIYIVRRTAQPTHLKLMVLNSLCECLVKELDILFEKQCSIKLCSSLREPQVLQTESNYRPIVNTRTREDVSKDYINHFLQINIQRDCFHLNLHEATSISGENERTYQNVRKLRSATFEFDLISALVKQLYNYIYRKPNKYSCKKKVIHRRHTQNYDDTLRKGLLYYIKVRDFC